MLYLNTLIGLQWNGTLVLQQFCKKVIILHYAIDMIPKMEEEFDIVFIDADKTNYSNYFDLVIDKVKSGGYIIADNVLWSGKVTKEQTD